MAADDAIRRPVLAIDRALDRVMAEIRDGLRHGYFDFGLTCETVNAERRRLVIRAGKTYQFMIPKDECVRSEGPKIDSPKGSNGSPT